MVTHRQVEEREARKERIVNGALQVFQKNGLEGSTMDEIAHEAGFGKATLYYYFESKEEVFCAIMEKGWKSLWEGIEGEVHTGSSPRTTFSRILKKIVQITLRNRNLYRFLFTAPPAFSHMPAGDQVWKKYQNRLYGVLSGLLEEGISKGEFPKVDPQLFLRAVGGLFHGLIFLGSGADKPKEEEIDELLSRFLTIPGVTQNGEHA